MKMPKVIDMVIEQIKIDVKYGDITAIEELLKSCYSESDFLSYLPDNPDYEKNPCHYHTNPKTKEVKGVIFVEIGDVYTGEPIWVSRPMILSKGGGGTGGWYIGRISLDEDGFPEPYGILTKTFKSKKKLEERLESYVNDHIINYEGGDPYSKNPTPKQIDFLKKVKGGFFGKKPMFTDDEIEKHAKGEVDLTNKLDDEELDEYYGLGD